MTTRHLGVERRRSPRFHTETVAVVDTTGVHTECRAANLSARGVLLTRRVDLPAGTVVTVTLHVPGSPPIRVRGRVIRDDDKDGDSRATAIGFVHESDATEDQIQAALLLELERARRNSA
jgi:hypothetical protein